MKNDITSILRLNSWAGRLVLIFYGVGTTIVAILNLGALAQPVLGFIALALLWGGLAMLGLPQGEPLPLRWTIGIIAIVTVTIALSSGNLLRPDNPGFANWPLGAMTFLLFVLALRGRRRFAWIGFGALAVVSVAVALVNGQELLPVVNDVARQSATLLIGTLFAIVLRRASQTIGAIQSAQLRRAALAAATAAETGESVTQHAQLENDSRPALERIISDAPFTSSELYAFAVLESSMRYGQQPRGFNGDRLADALRAASDRGLTVGLHNDRGADLSVVERESLERAMLPLLADLTVEAITVRLSAVGSGEIATVVVVENGVFRRVVVQAPDAVRVLA